MKQLFYFFLPYLLLVGCAQKESSEEILRPNIIWIVAEDISPALGCYGDSQAYTPNIDGLAAKGVIYEKAFATAPICAPSRSCLATGLYATSMGTQHLRCEVPLSPQLKTLPEYLSEAGYFTSNRNKSDYNFDHDGRWEHWSSSMAPWRKREEGDNRPFYSFINVGPSHEGSANKIDNYRNGTKDLPEDQIHDPADITLPPYYPDGEDTRAVWAHYYDLLTAMDVNVGKILDSLEADGLMDETVIFFFGDHGFGMPRYKRWLYNTGLQVPLVVYTPEKYQHLIPNKPGSKTNQLVSFVDFGATAMHLAGQEIPKTMEGQPFLGTDLPAERTYVFGARDRADDMYETSRAILNDRYIYIRHYMPHLPYIQSGYINSDVKDSYRALRAHHLAGTTNAEQEKLWNSKPIEELYDLQEDPWELNNLANDPSLTELKNKLHHDLQSWMIEHKDLGLLPEAEYMIRSEGSTPYDYARNGTSYEVEKILEAAEMVGKSSKDDILRGLQAEDSGIRYWALMAAMQKEAEQEITIEDLSSLLEDASPSVQIQAAEAILMKGNSPEAVEVLGKWVADDRGWLALEAARSIQLVGEPARPLIPIINEVLAKNLADPGGRLRYKDFNFSAFTSWALEWALQELGEDVAVNGGK